MKLKQHLLRIVRGFGCLSMVERLRSYISFVRFSRSNREFRRSNPKYAVPPFALAHDAYGHFNLHEIFSKGHETAALFAGEIDRHEAPDGTVLEWGCGPARILRHMPDLLSGHDYDLAGSDYNLDSITWCKANFPNIRFYTNDLAPPLSFASESVSCIYAFSVFTHLSQEMHEAWFQEISRVLRPKGLFIFTTHGEHFVHKLLPDEANQFRRGALVVRGRVEEGSRTFTAFHPADSIRRLIDRNDFLCLEFVPSHPLIKQDLWICRSRREQ